MMRTRAKPASRASTYSAVTSAQSRSWSVCRSSSAVGVPVPSYILLGNEIARAFAAEVDGVAKSSFLEVLVADVPRRRPNDANR